MKSLWLPMALVVAVAVAWSARAAEPERPWATGVPKEQQARALDLFREANGQLRDARYAAAREQYLDALAVWDHPAIHYNLALALLNLDRPVEAHEHLAQALKYGAAPLDPDKHEQAQRYQALVEKQLTRLVVLCALQDAVVRLDGHPLFVGPGRWEGMVRAGPHSIVGSRDGYVPVERSDTLIGGEAKEIELSLFRTEELTEYRRRWAPAVDWAVLGGGLVVIGGGVALRFAAVDAYARYDASVDACATVVAEGCRPHPDLTALRSGANGLQTLSVVAYALGGAAVVTGVVLAILNRPQPFLRSVTVGVSLLPPMTPGVRPEVLVSLGWRP
jgi:hypothetical protein